MEEKDQLETAFMRDPDSFYRKAEEERLREALTRSDKERFLVMTRLMKMNALFSHAKITSGKLS